MKTLDPCVVALIAFLLLLPVAMPVAADEETSLTSVDAPVALRGRHTITLNAGLLSHTKTETEVSGEGVTTENSTNGFSGSLSYAYWFKQDMSVGIDVGLIAAEATTSTGIGGVKSESAVVIPLLFGIAYSPDQLALSPTMRSYGSASIGPYLGLATNTQVGATVGSESVSETTLGLRVRGGIDWFLGEWFKLDITGGYHFVSKFKERIGTEKDYSGPEFSIGFGVLLGKAH